jgi:hypothetical protein
MNFILLIIALPTDNAAGRMRAWRAVKASGAAVLRDGVYLLPEHGPCLAAFDALIADIQTGGGATYLLHVNNTAAVDYSSLFKRDAEYTALLADIAAARAGLAAVEKLSATFKKIAKLRKALAQLMAIDFFPNASQAQVQTALAELADWATRLMAPDEPHPTRGLVPVLAIADYQHKIWATRSRPWADRLACAWLIRRFIDTDAHFLWLESPAACPADALGFDFDGATFSHVGHYVTFEVLLAAFGFEQAALKRVAALVHYLDVGGVQPAEAAGVESVLKGLRDAITNDDQLLATAGSVFDGLLATFERETREV